MLAFACPILVNFQHVGSVLIIAQEDTDYGFEGGYRLFDALGNRVGYSTGGEGLASDACMVAREIADSQV